MRKTISFILWIISFSVFAQDLTAIRYSESITPADLKADLSIIASDFMEGRETGKRGQKMAAAFIATTFQELGLKGPVDGDYYQHVPLFSAASSNATLSSNQVELSGQDFFYMGGGETNGQVESRLVFVGRGTEAEIAKVNVKNKAVIFLRENGFPGSEIRFLKEKGAAIVLIASSTNEEYNRLSSMLNKATSGRLSLSNISSADNTLGTFYLSPKAIELLFNLSLEKLKSAIKDKRLDRVNSIQIKYAISPSSNEIKSENVLGYLEGSDKKDELVIITAHYDHIGMSEYAVGDKINNGADDDGSGTVAVLALARAFAKAKSEGKGPRRSILFMTVTGEEKGLLGSQYYTDHPVFSLENTVVDLNIDMIGRRDPQHAKSEPYVYVIGSDKLSNELHQLSENTNKAYTHLTFDYTYNDPTHPDRLYYRSDHWNFAKKNIPIIFYFDGIHEDYHKPGDELNKIEFDLLTQRTKTVFFTAWELANRENRIAIDIK
jgi:hypothetical protein